MYGLQVIGLLTIVVVCCAATGGLIWFFVDHFVIRKEMKERIRLQSSDLREMRDRIYKLESKEWERQRKDAEMKKEQTA